MCPRLFIPTKNEYSFKYNVFEYIGRKCSKSPSANCSIILLRAGTKKIPCRLGTGLKAHRCDESGRVKHCQRGTLKQRVQCREGQNPCLYRVSRYCVTVCNQECVSEICVGMAELRKYPITGAGHLACAMSGNCRDWPWFPGTFWRRMRRPRSRWLPFSKSLSDGNPTALPRPA